MTTFDDFEKIDIRIGTVIKAQIPDWSHWVMKLTVDFGPEIGEKTAFSGIMKFYKPEELENKQFPFVVNLEPKKIGPEKELSEAMMLMATPQASLLATPSEEEDMAPILFQLQQKVDNGTKVG